MRTIWPFYGALIAALMLVTYVPGFPCGCRAHSATWASAFLRYTYASFPHPQGGIMNNTTPRRHFLHAVAAAVSLCLAPLAFAAPQTINIVDPAGNSR
jgi:hypothetical protein